MLIVLGNSIVKSESELDSYGLNRVSIYILVSSNIYIYIYSNVDDCSLIKRIIYNIMYDEVLNTYTDTHENTSARNLNHHTINL